MMNKKAILLVFAALLLISGCNNGYVCPDGNVVDNPSLCNLVEEVSGENAKASTAITAQVGLAAKPNEISYLVTDVSSPNVIGSSYNRKKADGKYVIVDMIITNEGKIFKTIDYQMFYIVDSEDRIYSHDLGDDINLIHMKNRNPIFIEKVQPSVSHKGSLLFEVAKDAEDLQLAILENIGDENPIVFVDLSSSLEVIEPIPKAIPWEEHFATCDEEHSISQSKNKALIQKYTDECMANYAGTYGLIEWCDKIIDRVIQHQCYFNVAITTQDRSICEEYLLGSEKGDCIRSTQY